MKKEKSPGKPKNRIAPGRARKGVRFDSDQMPGVRPRNSPIGLPARTMGQGQRMATMKRV